MSNPMHLKRVAKGAVLLCLILGLPGLSEGRYHSKQPPANSNDTQEPPPKKPPKAERSPSMSQPRHRHLQVLPSAHQIKKEQVTVGAEFLNTDLANNIFDTDLVGRGIQPLTIAIENRSNQTYAFRKADVDEHYIPAAQAAKAAYQNPVKAEGQAVGWFLLRIPKLIASVTSKRHRPSLASGPFINRDIQADFVKEEIADTTIGPNGSLTGFLFLGLPRQERVLTIKLLNVQTQQPLIFEIPTEDNRPGSSARLQ